MHGELGWAVKLLADEALPPDMKSGRDGRRSCLTHDLRASVTMVNAWRRNVHRTIRRGNAVACAASPWRMRRPTDSASHNTTPHGCGIHRSAGAGHGTLMSANPRAQARRIAGWAAGCHDERRPGVAVDLFRFPARHGNNPIPGEKHCPSLLPKFNGERLGRRRGCGHHKRCRRAECPRPTRSCRCRSRCSSVGVTIGA